MSAAEKLRRRAQQREQALAAAPTLLYSRRQTAKALGGISIATVLRLEAAKRLTPIKLLGAANGLTFYRPAEVHALAEGRSAEKRHAAQANDADTTCTT